MRIELELRPKLKGTIKKKLSYSWVRGLWNLLCCRLSPQQKNQESKKLRRQKRKRQNWSQVIEQYGQLVNALPSALPTSWTSYCLLPLPVTCQGEESIGLFVVFVCLFVFLDLPTSWTSYCMLPLPITSQGDESIHWFLQLCLLVCCICLSFWLRPPEPLVIFHR